MGGHDWTDAAGQPRSAVVTDQFGLVISLFTRAGHGPDPGVEHCVAEIPDGPLSADQIDQVRQLATKTADAVRQQRTTLVRCHAGYNRSGLVVAQALIELGHDSSGAIALIRRRRSPWALHNAAFVAYLDAGLAAAHLLTGLDEAG
jgi:protein-tyrosine phosphatase